MKGNVIYGLVDPRTLLIRYVGQTSDPAERFKQHRYGPKVGRTYSARWIKSLQKAGLHFIPVLLEQLADDSSNATIDEAEIWWIVYGRLSGWDLTNLTDGGGGARGHRHTEETKTRMSFAQLGKRNSLGHKQTDEDRAKKSDALMGHTHTEESKAKMSATATGRKIADTTKAKMSKAQLGVPKTAKHKANMKAAWVLRKRKPVQ